MKDEKRKMQIACKLKVTSVENISSLKYNIPLAKVPLTLFPDFRKKI
jgi:hypothetical protein